MLTREDRDEMRGLIAFAGLGKEDATALLNHADQADEVIHSLREIIGMRQEVEAQKDVWLAERDEVIAQLREALDQIHRIATISPKTEGWRIDELAQRALAAAGREK